MNFFEHQERARRRSLVLVVLFALAVCSLIALTYALVTLFFAYFESGVLDVQRLLTTINSERLFYTAVGILSVVLVASFYKFIQLGSDGRAVAESLGGRPISQNTEHAHERRVLNIVEEMAIASGMPVPAVYVIDEPSINAFAAGYSVNTAIVGVTRGCIELLNRNELQGVIAHEFSHIFNGDMRLNMRLVGVLHGILIIGITGRVLFHLVARSGYRGRSNKHQSALPFLALGGALMVVGYLGTLFGNIIKAAVSRQREFLADASAVQYTRDPNGISSALQKIGGVASGSLIQSTEPSEFSHLFFGPAIKPFFSAVMATHPPLQERIRRVTPHWDGRYPVVSGPLAQGQGSGSGFSSEHLQAAAFAAPPLPVDAKRISGTIDSEIGLLNDQQLYMAHRFLDALPEAIINQCRDPFGARAIVYCVLLDISADAQADQLRLLAEMVDPGLIELVRGVDLAVTCDPANRLKLVDLCLPALRQLSAQQYQAFKGVMVALIRVDKQVSLFEWALYRVIITAIEGRGGATSRNEITSLKFVARPLAILLSATACSAAVSDDSARAAFDEGKQQLGLARINYRSPEHYTLRDLSAATAQLDRLRPLQKPKVLKALCACATHDGVVQPVELELIRAISDCIDCPMPIIV